MKPKIVLVGVGKFGSNHLRVLKELENDGMCEVYGIIDKRIEVLESIRKNYDVATSTSLKEFLEDADAVDIVTPTDTHFKICKQCLAAGKHVMVEKPLTTSYAEAKELVQMAAEKNKTLMAGHIFRYNPAVRKIKELIEHGDLGELYYMFGHYMGLKDPRLDVGALFNYAVHHIDIYNYLLGKTPEQATCCIGHFLNRKNLEDLAILALRYQNGIMGIVEGSWLPPGKHRDLTIIGSEKSVTSNLLKQSLTIHNVCIERKDGILRAVNGGSLNIKIKFQEPLKLELKDFVECVKTGRKPLADGQAALDAIKVAEKALESARLKRSVKIDEEK